MDCSAQAATLLLRNGDAERVGNTVVWNAAAGISGAVNIGAHADFASNAGMSYASPGYL